jgi:hypothetical protein
MSRLLTGSEEEHVGDYYDAERIKFLLKPKHWKAAREIVILMEQVEQKVSRDFWREVEARLKKRSRGIGPEYFDENNSKGLWAHIPYLVGDIYFDIGQAVETGRHYYYCEIAGPRKDKRAKALFRKLEGATIADVKFWQNSEEAFAYREFTPTGDPNDWPLYGKKYMADLADEFGERAISFLNDVKSVVKRSNRGRK